MFLNIKKICGKKLQFIIVAAILAIGGFFVAYQVLATHTATVDMVIKNLSTNVISAVDIGQEFNLEFTATKNTGSSLGAIKVSYPSDFTAPTSISCPTEFKSSEINQAGNYVKCAMGDAGTSITSGKVILNSIKAPAIAGEKTFSVDTIDVDFDKETQTKSVEVKNLSATIGITPITTNVSQIRDYTFTVTNTTGDYVDNITGISGTLGGLTINNCSATGWSYTPAGNSFTLSGGTLTPGAAVEITVNATAPASAGAQTMSATLTGALGGTASASVNPNTIQVQIPASLSAGEISSDIARISKNPGAYNTATISVQVTNGGQATANTLVKSLVIKNSADDIISD